MCLITEKKGFRIAKKDIPVWKVLSTNGISPYQGFMYERDVLYEQPLELVDEKLYNKLLNGHSDDRICPFDGTDAKYLSDKHKWWGGCEYIPELIYIRKGLHSAGSARRLGRSSIVEFIIPKGSRYYTDATDLYVSNRLILKNHEEKTNI